MRGERRCRLAFESGKAKLPIRHVPEGRRWERNTAVAGKNRLRKAHPPSTHLSWESKRSKKTAHRHRGSEHGQGLGLVELRCCLLPSVQDQWGSCQGPGTRWAVFPAPSGKVPPSLGPSLGNPSSRRTSRKSSPLPTPGLMNPSCHPHSPLLSTAQPSGHYLCDHLLNLDQTPSRDFDQRS